MKKLLMFLIIIFLVTTISAQCQENQININSASLEKLDELYGIGEVKAQAIIDSRPFETVDDLINVYGIGEKTLEKIKSQALACVEESEQDQNQTQENSQEPEISQNKETSKDSENLEQNSESEDLENQREFKENTKEDKEIFENNSSQEIYSTPINLNAKTIKTQESDNKSKENFSFPIIITFCVLLILLYLIKKPKQKNEFQN